ncbi:hypothetical protein KM043_012858 [Ampulex compressa]|nr:hypothetical protein KM043_012858 [Ampulex compressa]
MLLDTDNRIIGPGPRTTLGPPTSSTPLRNHVLLASNWTTKKCVVKLFRDKSVAIDNTSHNASNYYRGH